MLMPPLESTSTITTSWCRSTRFRLVSHQIKMLRSSNMPKFSNRQVVSSHRGRWSISWRTRRMRMIKVSSSTGTYKPKPQENNQTSHQTSPRTQRQDREDIKQSPTGPSLASFKSRLRMTTSDRASIRKRIGRIPLSLLHTARDPKTRQRIEEVLVLLSSRKVVSTMEISQRLQTPSTWWLIRSLELSRAKTSSTHTPRLWVSTSKQSSIKPTILLSIWWHPMTISLGHQAKTAIGFQP